MSWALVANEVFFLLTYLVTKLNFKNYSDIWMTNILSLVLFVYIFFHITSREATNFSFQRWTWMKHCKLEWWCIVIALCFHQFRFEFSMFTLSTHNIRNFMRNVHIFHWCLHLTIKSITGVNYLSWKVP